MAWTTGAHDGNAVTLLDALVTFLTTDATLVADSDAWTVLGQCTEGLTHPTDDDYIVTKGYYLRGAGLASAPILFIYSVETDENATSAIAFTAMQGFDAELADMWWAQPGASYHYAPLTVPKTVGTYEFMANGQRTYGYIKDELERYMPFYAGWIIPYTDTQSQNYVQPTACLGSDKFLKYCSVSSTNADFSVGLCNMDSGDTTSVPSADRSNAGAFIIAPDSSFRAIQASSSKPVVSVTSTRMYNTSLDWKYHIKSYAPVTSGGITPLYPEVLRYDDSVLLGELDGLCSIGRTGAIAGAIISDSDDVEWIVIMQRNQPANGVDGYAMKRA